MKKLTTVLAVVAIVATASIGMGAIVNYLSNDISANISVNAPFGLYVAEGIVNDQSSDEWMTEPGNIELTSGSTYAFSTMLENTANNDIDADLQITINCPQGIDGGEITSLMVQSVENVETGTVPNDGYWSSATYPVELVNQGYGSAGDYKLTYTVPLGEIPAETAYIVGATITLSEYATAEYSLSMQIV